MTFDVEWDASRLHELIPDLDDVYHGHDGVRTYWRGYAIEDGLAAVGLKP